MNARVHVLCRGVGVLVRQLDELGDELGPVSSSLVWDARATSGQLDGAIRTGDKV